MTRLIARPIDQWPGQLTPDHKRQYHRFDAGWTDTVNILKREAAQLGAREIVLQLDITERMCRNDGWIRADAKPGHPGVIVSLDAKVGPLRFSTDRFKGGGYQRDLTAWQANVRAIALGLEALRKVDRYGIGSGSEQYQGWKAIGSGTPMPAASLMNVDDAAVVLAGQAGGVEPIADRAVRLLGDPDYVQACFRIAAKRHHPDVGGDPAMFRRLTEARDLLLEAHQ